MPTSRELLVQDLTTWIHCQNDPRKRETAKRIEQQWQAEYRSFANRAQRHLHPDGLALMEALDFPFHASDTDNGSFQNLPIPPNDQDEEICATQARWIFEAAEWINSEQNGKQKSQAVRKWETTQQEEFQKWTDPTKDSLS